MGKNGKERKRRKLENALISSFDNTSECSDEDDNATGFTMKQSELENCITCLNFVGKNLDLYHSATYKMLRKIIFPLIEEQKLKYFEKTCDNECEDQIDALSFDLASATKAFSKLSQDIPLFLSAELKSLRKALYPLIVDSRESSGLKCSVTLSGQVSLALSSKQWTEAYRYLKDMKKNHIIPKLGALQRWVRQVDDVADRPLAILLLRAILDVTKLTASCSPATVCGELTKRCRDEESTLLSGLGDAKEAVKIEHLEPFRFSITSTPQTAVCDDKSGGSGDLPAPLAADFPVVFCIAGKDRRPQSDEDMNIYTSRLGAFHGFSTAAEATTTAVRTDIPNVPGAFLLSNVLTATECDQLVRAAEMLGYSRDAVEGIDAQVWLAQQDVTDAIFSRCSALLPQKNALGHPLVGINKRFRFFRYGAGAVYRPHIDGSWTGGGIDPVTLEYKDNLHANHHSYMTFLIYLNGNFTGGGTTFFVSDVTSTSAETTDHTAADPPTQQDPSSGFSAGAIYAQSVVPAQGSILCFPHGTVEGSLIHEGSAVLEGVKYVIRSDVMYDLLG